MSAPSSTKKMKGMSTDRLSALPDDVLCYILSFLEMKEASITCLLSKRWKFLWTQLPGLRFWDSYSRETEKMRSYANRVNRTLAMCSRHNLERFEVHLIWCKHLFFERDKNLNLERDINGWITFAVEKKVKVFILQLHYDYVLSQMMYSNPCWTSLTLGGCIMAPPGTIQWQSLTMLRIERVELKDNTFEEIFSGCPVLSSLDIVNCWGFHHLEVNSASLGTLAIEVAWDRDCLKISAPYIHTFKIVLRTNGRMVHLENIESVVKAEVTLVSVMATDPNQSWPKYLERLFGSIGHVKMLKLGRRSIQHLSIIAPSWQPPQSTTKCLELHVMPGKRIIAGIVTVLESSPNLETLVIHGDDYYRTDITPDPASKDDLDCDLFHLKTVCFKKFRNLNDDIDEPVLTLARILLKRAIVLEKMVIDFPRSSAPSSVIAFDKITRELLIHSRSSQKAVVLFN